MIAPQWNNLTQPSTQHAQTLHLLSINAGRMMEILDIQMNQGGTTWPAGEKIQTVYQVIAIPGELELCLKVPGFQDWTFVDLAPLFESDISPK
ncbi:MAG TPA: hypothetical protein PLQ82_02785 [Desulfobacteraceae bacterium]|nr:hypothetical protein [Desulfobacteraceae bacterium]HPQ27375.1 hypothetical protein [Desulfobacteraceae bacterium]